MSKTIYNNNYGDKVHIHLDGSLEIEATQPNSEGVGVLSLTTASSQALYNYLHEVFGTLMEVEDIVQALGKDEFIQKLTAIGHHLFGVSFERELAISMRAILQGVPRKQIVKLQDERSFNDLLAGEILKLISPHEKPNTEVILAGIGLSYIGLSEKEISLVRSRINPIKRLGRSEELQLLQIVIKLKEIGYD